MGSGLNRGHGGSEGMGASVDPPHLHSSDPSKVDVVLPALHNSRGA